MSMCYWCRRNSYCQAMEKAQYKAVNDGVMYCEIFNPVALPVISMGRTSPPWVNKEKSVTRRNWSKRTIRRFRKNAYYVALSKQRLFGGQAIGIGKMTADSFREDISVNYKGDNDKFWAFYEAEGFRFLDDKWCHAVESEYPALMGKAMNWIDSGAIYTVVPFEIIEVFPGMKDIYSTDKEIIRCVEALVKVLP